jgi:hypothetical protein
METLEDFKNLEDLPYGFTHESDWSWRDYKFYKTKKGFGNSLGNYKRLPEHINFWPIVIPFREQHGLDTVSDIVDLLNSWGYNPSIQVRLRDHFGIEFSKEEWVWSAAYPETPLTRIEPQGGSTGDTLGLGLQSKLHYSYYESWSPESGYPCFSIFVVVKNSFDTGLPDWLTKVNNYKYVPDKLTFVHSDNEYNRWALYFGMEIEVSSKISPAELQYIVTSVEPVQEPFFYHKHDGSIKERNGYSNRYEIVTFPMSYKCLKHEFEVLFDKLKRWEDKELFAWGSDTGLHIHVSNNSFTSRLHRNKFAALWNQHGASGRKFIETIGKRPFNAYCEPFNDHYGRTNSYKLKHGSYAPGHDSSRRAACRQTNNTSEVRIFAGGFDLEHIKYCLEAVHAMHSYSDKVPIGIISSPSFPPDFTEWLSTEPRYKRLQKELKACA